MTASPPDADAGSGEFIARNAKNSAPDAHVGLPSEETVAALIEEHLPTFRGSREAARAIHSLIRPAFEAKDQRIRELVMLLDKQMGTPCEQIRHQQEIEAKDAEIAATHDVYQQAAVDAVALFHEAEARALSAEAKLAQAVEDEREACAKIAEDYPAHEHGHLDADPHYAARQAAHEVAGAIRARSASRGATE